MTSIGGRTWGKLAIAVVAGCVLATPALAAKQMDATDSPRASGELDLQTESCQTENEKHQGAVVARGKTCLRIYSYDQASETDTDRNYGVAWLQSNVNSRLGWCAAKVLADIDLPTTLEVESRAPRAMTVKRRKTYDTVLTTNADGNASDTAQDSAVRQRQILYPGELRVWVIGETNVFRLKWLGLRDAKLGFASGAEVSWPSGANPDPVTYRLNYELQRGAC